MEELRLRRLTLLLTLLFAIMGSLASWILPGQRVISNQEYDEGVDDDDPLPSTDGGIDSSGVLDRC